MPDKLDDKLRVILDDHYEEANADGRRGEWPNRKDEDYLAQIKQAFAESRKNYIRNVPGTQLMTGQEWYNRFEKELMDIPVLWTDEIPKQLNPYALKVLEAAKRAAGIE